MSTSNPAGSLPNGGESAAVEPRQMSSAARILGVFYAPVKTFEDIAREPHFYLCWLVQILAAELFAWTALHRIGAAAIIRNGLLQSSRGRNMSADQIQSAVQHAAPIVRWNMYFSPLFVLLTLVILAGIFYAMEYFALGQKIRFKPVMAMVSHAFLPLTLLSLLGSLVIRLTPDPTNLQLNNLLGSNPAYFFDPSSTSPVLMALMMRLDIFSLWVTALLGLGTAKVGLRVKISTGMKVAFGLWALFILVAVGWAAIFG